MKQICLTLAILLSFNAQAEFLFTQAIDASEGEAALELNLNEIEAIKIENEGDEVVVEYKTHDGTLGFGCHFDGGELACHDEDQHHLKSEFDQYMKFKAAVVASISTLNDVLTNMDSDISALNSIVSWKEEDHHDHGHKEDHVHEGNVWSKVNFNFGGRKTSRYIVCHKHRPTDVKFHCTIRLKGPAVPQF